MKWKQFLGKLLRRRQWLDWNQYAKKIQFLETFEFQQKTRKESIANLDG